MASSDDKISAILPPGLNLEGSESVCTLWAGYGSIKRLSVRSEDDDDPSARPRRKLILKTVIPPAVSERTVRDESNSRKVISYNVERYFYRNLSGTLSDKSGLFGGGGGGCVGSYDTPVVAEYIPLREGHGDDVAGHSLLLSDLKEDFPFEPFDGLAKAQTECVLRWLASFHAAFWHPLENVNYIPAPSRVSNPQEASGVWEQGGYWYLDTRSSEYDSMLQDRDEWGWLTPYATVASEKIKNTDGKFKTLIHGDAKAANILFNNGITPGAKKRARATGGPAGIIQQQEADEGLRCAMYDFQYVGRGLGAQDLAYFLGTSASGSLLVNGKDEEMLRYYYEHLETAYAATHEGRTLEGVGYTFDVLKEHFEVAVVDWMRFMAGWGVWGNGNWVEKTARGVVEKWKKEGK